GAATTTPLHTSATREPSHRPTQPKRQPRTSQTGPTQPTHAPSPDVRTAAGDPTRSVGEPRPLHRNTRAQHASRLIAQANQSASSSEERRVGQDRTSRPTQNQVAQHGKPRGA